MRIGFDAKRLYSNLSGLGNYSRTLLKNLSAYHPDHDYYLYTTKILDTRESAVFLNDQRFNTYISTAFFKSLWRSKGIVKALQSDNLDIYHGLSHEIPIGIQGSGIKSVVTIHDTIFKVYPEYYPIADRLFYNFKFRNCCTHADRIIAISENTKRDIIKYYGVSPDKIELIYQACDPIYYKADEQFDKNRILAKYGLPERFLLYVGSIEKRKNIELILNAYRYFPKGEKIPLVIIGKGKKHKERLLKIVKAEQIESLILWKDNVEDNHDLKQIYQSAEILIYPSLYEGFGLPIVEALLCKTPVITSNTSSLMEAGGPDSIYVSPDDPKQLASAIQDVLAFPDLRQKMVQNGYEYATENFDPVKLSRQIIQLYTSLLKN